MNITVNGNSQNVISEISVEDLLVELGYKNDFVAVAVNQSCVPRSNFKTHRIHAHDDIEILAPMSGG